jgi:hypothetical protein
MCYLVSDLNICLDYFTVDYNPFTTIALTIGLKDNEFPAFKRIEGYSFG